MTLTSLSMTPVSPRTHDLGIILSSPFYLQTAPETDFEDVEQREER